MRAHLSLEKAFTSFSDKLWNQISTSESYSLSSTPINPSYLSEEVSFIDDNNVQQMIHIENPNDKSDEEEALPSTR